MVLLLIIYVSFISVGAPTYLLGAAWPMMHEAIGAPVSSVGIISIIIMGFTVIASFLCERIIKLASAGILAALSILLLAVSLFGFTVSGSLIALCICAVPMGFGIGLADAVLNNFVAVHYKAMHMSWLHCFWGIGATIGPVILSFSMSYYGTWSAGYRIISLLQFSLVLLIVFSLPMWKRATKEPVQENERKKAPVKLRELYRLKGIKPVLLIFFCYCAIEATIGLWGSSYLVLEKGAAPDAAARWTALFFLGLTLGRFLSGFMAMKLSGAQMLRLSCALIAFGLLITAFFTGNAAYITGFFVMGLGCASIFPCLLHQTPARFGKEYSQAVIGAQIAVAYFGSAIIPPLFGIVAEHMGYGSLPAFLGVFFAAMVIMMEALNKKSFSAERDLPVDV